MPCNLTLGKFFFFIGSDSEKGYFRSGNKSGKDQEYANNDIQYNPICVEWLKG